MRARAHTEKVQQNDLLGLKHQQKKQKKHIDPIQN